MKVLAAGTLILGLFGASATTPASSEEPLAPVVNLGVSVVSNPTVVAPVGEKVYYKVTVSNEASPVPVDATLTDTTVNADVLEVLPPAGVTCSAVSADETFTCDMTLAQGQTAVVDVIAATLNAGTATNSASVTLAPSPLELLGVAEGSATTTVLDTGSSAFLRKGDSLTFKGHTMTVREAEFGVVGSMADATGIGATCGGGPCNTEALNVDFKGGQQDGPFFGLVEVRVNFENGDPCFGTGTIKCFGLFYRKIAGSPFTFPVPDCPDSDEPCLESHRKTATGFERVVVMETSDPDLLEQAKKLTSGT